ncbi:hypothetical protein C1646_664268 [Rhizophagus diaphanus]|nr:hypothetical protein C1646_664268 [Rhizophagus diaphanus] [Rhizophagus sp. MUCL 43196]
MDWQIAQEFFFILVISHHRRFSNLEDDYPDGDPHGLTTEIVLKKMQSKNILYFFFGKITDFYTDKMLEIFRGIVDKFPVFDLVGEDLIKLIENFIKATSSITIAGEIFSLQRKKHGMNPNELNWNNLPLQKGVVMWNSCLDIAKVHDDPETGSLYFWSSYILI